MTACVNGVEDGRHATLSSDGVFLVGLHIDPEKNIDPEKTSQGRKT
jgi:hypothetical protein